MEMGDLGGTVTFSNLAGRSSNVFSVGDKWQISIVKGPPKTTVNLLTSNVIYPQQYKALGTTDASGDFTLSGTITQDQAGTSIYWPIDMLFPNSVGGYTNYQDPNAPTGYRNVLVALIDFSVRSSTTQ